MVNCASNIGSISAIFKKEISQERFNKKIVQLHHRIYGNYCMALLKIAFL